MHNRPHPASLPGISRANPLATYRVEAGATDHRLLLNGPAHVADQIVILAPEYSRTVVPRSDAQTWTHILVARGAVRQEVVDLLDACQGVVCLPCKRLDAAIALDWYKVPHDDVEPSQWPDTPVGQLVHLGKYRYRNRPKIQRPIGTKLTDLLSQTAQTHPLVSRAEVVVDVPGHDRTRVSFGSQLSESVAQRLNVPFARTAARSTFRPQAKDTPTGQRSARLQGEFHVDDSVRGKHVLIVDDVYQSGASVDAVAAAAHAVGARSVCALCAARTMRS